MYRHMPDQTADVSSKGPQKGESQIPAAFLCARRHQAFASAVLPTDWVAVKESNFNYYIGETILINMYIYI